MTAEEKGRIVEIIKETDCLKPPKGNKGSRKPKPFYKNLVCAFDIETTYIKDINQSVMYSWQFELDNKMTVIGRTWDEYGELLDIICENLKTAEFIVVYVHNLSYEFQFLSGIYDFKSDEVFAVDSRKILKCTQYNHIEYRCSYLHSNMSLDKYLKKMDVPNKKLAYDYSKQRFSFTPLDQSEIDYITNDVKGLVQAIRKEMALEGDDLYTIPFTSTGYVRRDFKKAIRSCRWVRSLLPDFETYEMLRKAFRGGNTHANRFFAGEILTDVKSADRSSSYPETQCNHTYPISPFRFVDNATVDTLQSLITRRNKAVLVEVNFKGVKLHRYDWGCPYLSKDKCSSIINGVYDNGRILSCDYCNTTITDIDFKIIINEYDIEGMEVAKLCYANYGKLPSVMTDLIKDYYRRKTELKNVDGHEYYYHKAKEKLNAIYGMTAQDPAIDTILYEDNEFHRKSENVSRETLLAENHPWLPYQWGVWCTAWARWELERGIILAHDQGFFVYTDTDSVKYLGDLDWSGYNQEKEEVSKYNGAYATDSQGVTHYMGQYEIEQTYCRFITLGAKKYAFTYYNEDGLESDAHITVAGVPKKAGAEELQKAGGIELFKPGFLFNAGKLESVYNDDPEIKKYEIDGHVIDITKNVALRPTTYLLSITAEYEELLSDREIYEKAIRILDIRPQL